MFRVYVHFKARFVLDLTGQLTFIRENSVVLSKSLHNSASARIRVNGSGYPSRNFRSDDCYAKAERMLRTFFEIRAL